MKRTLALLTAAVLAATAATATFAAAEDMPPGPPPDNGGVPVADQSLSGTVKNFNYGPRGNVEGLLLSANNKLVQVNFPPPLAQEVTQSVNVGDQITMDVRPDNGPRGRGPGAGGPGGGDGQGGPDNQSGGPGRRGQRNGGGGGARGQSGGGPHGGAGGRPDGPPEQNADRGPGPLGAPDSVQPDHSVYRLVSLTDAKGHEITDGPQANGKPAHVEGTISAINYDPRGRPNGAQLSTGDFVRINPQEMSQLHLKTGDRLSADGTAQPLATGKGQLIDATHVNGTEVHAGPPRNGPRGSENEGPPGPPPPNNDGPQ